MNTWTVLHMMINFEFHFNFLFHFLFIVFVSSFVATEPYYVLLVSKLVNKL